MPPPIIINVVAATISRSIFQYIAAVFLSIVPDWFVVLAVNLVGVIPYVPALVPIMTGVIWVVSAGLVFG